MPGLVDEETKLGKQVAELWEAATDDSARVTVMNSLKEEISAVKITAAKLLRAERRLYLREDTERKARLAEIMSPVIKQRKKSFDETIAADYKNMPACRV